MKLSHEQRGNLRDVLTSVHAAINHLDYAIDHVPVIGDAELHTMRLDLKNMTTKLRYLRDNAAEILAGAK